MADDKKNISEVAPPTEAPAPTVEVTAVPELLAPEPVLTDAEVVMLEQEGQAALFEMGEAVPDPADAVTHAEVEEPAAPEVPKAEKEQEQPPELGKPEKKTDLEKCPWDFLPRGLSFMNGGFYNETPPRVYHRRRRKQRPRKHEAGGAVLPHGV